MALLNPSAQTAGAISFLERRGLKELVERLRQIPLDLGAKGHKRDMGRRILWNAMKAGAELVRDAAASRVSYRTGELRRSIGAQEPPWARHNRTTTLWNVTVGSSIAHLIEFGVGGHWITPRSDSQKRITALRAARATGDAEQAAALLIGGQFVGRKVWHPGFAAIPFLRPAFEQNAERVISVVAARIRAQLDSYDQGRRYRL